MGSLTVTVIYCVYVISSLRESSQAPYFAAVCYLNCRPLAVVGTSKQDTYIMHLFHRVNPKKVHQKEKAASDRGVRGAGMYQDSISLRELCRTKALRKLASATGIACVGSPLPHISLPRPLSLYCVRQWAFLEIRLSVSAY